MLTAAQTGLIAKTAAKKLNLADLKSSIRSLARRRRGANSVKTCFWYVAFANVYRACGWCYVSVFAHSQHYFEQFSNIRRTRFF